jgi:hypothetical protein
MWIFMNDAMLSIVDPQGSYDGGSGPKGADLLVRARIAGDIEAVFPLAKVTKTPGRDYLFRALIPRKEVALAIADRVLDISAQNFKGSVHDRARHDAYLDCWYSMNSYQKRKAAR